MGDLLVIHFLEGTCHGVSFVGPLFALDHFCPLQYFVGFFFPYYNFFSLLNDFHIIGPTYIIHLAFDHFVFQLVFMGLFI